MTFIGPNQRKVWTELLEEAYGKTGLAITGYVGHTQAHNKEKPFTPIGTLISYLSQRLARENASLRALADYYRITNIAGAGGGDMRKWPSSIYSEGIRGRVEAGKLTNIAWDEWNIAFF
jgi:hypothetical protein